MTLRETVRLGKIPPLPRMPKPRVVEQEKVLTEKFDAIQSPSALDADALIRRLKEFSVEQKWDQITFREWKKAAWVLFGDSTSLANDRGFFDRLLGEYRKRNKPSAYKGLVLAYLRDFDPKSPAIRRTGREISQIVDQYAWPWKQRAKEYGLFHETAPAMLAAACLHSDKPMEVLGNAGLGGPRAAGGFAACAYSQALRLLREMLSNREPNFSLLDRILEWSISDNGLRYPKDRAQLANALLLPWVQRSPPDDQRHKIFNFLLGYFRDPRLPKNAKGWIGVEDQAVAVLRRWLTSVALEQFFDVVDQVAKESMWKYRRAFWTAYLKRDVISDARVIFGPDARTYAIRAFGETLSYGLLERAGTQPNHSVLLMKIDKLTIADWSHDGKCNIWKDGNPDAPKLDHSSYRRDALVHNSDNGGQVHYSSERGNWQGKVATYIRNQTGISVSEAEYMTES